MLNHFSKQFFDKTIIRYDGYTLYRHRKPGSNEDATATIIEGNREFTIDNSMVVQYNYHCSGRGIIKIEKLG